MNNVKCNDSSRWNNLNNNSNNQATHNNNNNKELDIISRKLNCKLSTDKIKKKRLCF